MGGESLWDTLNIKLHGHTGWLTYKYTLALPGIVLPLTVYPNLKLLSSIVEENFEKLKFLFVFKMAAVKYVSRFSPFSIILRSLSFKLIVRFWFCIGYIRLWPRIFPTTFIFTVVLYLSSLSLSKSECPRPRTYFPVVPVSVILL